jgi:hypothetical protein
MDGVILSLFYTILIIIFGKCYNMLAIKMTKNENYQFQKHYDDAFISRVFRFNFINSYVPLFILAFVKREFLPIWIQLATHLAFSQFLATIVEWIKPKITVAKKLENIRETFAETIEVYENIDEDTEFDHVMSGDISIRKYQAMRDSNMLASPPDVVNDYMKLI